MRIERRPVTHRRGALGIAVALAAFFWWACVGSGAVDSGEFDDASVPPESSADARAANDVVLDAPLDLGKLDAGRSVFQHHNHASRDGLFADSALTKAAAATMHADTTFDAPITGPVFAQPLFIEQGPGGKHIFIVATERNVVYALDEADGGVVWKTPELAPPAVGGYVTCSNINPSGITGTPYVDIPARTIYLDAISTASGSARHQIYALSLDDGSVRTGWPVDVETALSKIPGAPKFTSAEQVQRGALAFVDDVLYIPYGGNANDCGMFHGWVVGVDPKDPTRAMGWWTAAQGGGIWGPSGLASDGTSVYATTGNTFDAGGLWQGGCAVFRFGKGPSFTQSTKDYYVPQNWQELDDLDFDLGGAAAVVVDVPGATPSKLVVAMGKDGKVYLLDRAKLGGNGGEVASKVVVNGIIYGASTAYTTPKGTFLALRNHTTGAVICPGGRTGEMTTVHLTATNPPAIEAGWCSQSGTVASPMSTTTGNGADTMVWVVTNPETANARLEAYDGETGDVIFDGGAGADLMASVHHFQTPIVANGRVFVGGHDRLYAFKP